MHVIVHVCAYIIILSLPSLSPHPPPPPLSLSLSLSFPSIFRIIVIGEVTNLVANQSAQVFRFESVYNLSPELTSNVGDHYPVEFQLQSTACLTDAPTTATAGALSLKWSQFLSVFLFVLLPL